MTDLGALLKSGPGGAVRVEFGAVHGTLSEGESDRAQGFSIMSAPDTGTTQLTLTPPQMRMDGHHAGPPSTRCQFLHHRGFPDLDLHQHQPGGNLE